MIPIPNKPPLKLGTRTKWGIIVQVGFITGERYYWMEKDGMISMMPAVVVE